MPRSKRQYGDPAPKTLATAIAYVHVAQQTKGLHGSTRSRVMDFYDFAASYPHYRFREEGLEIARSAPLWAAYEWCRANGYSLRRHGRHDMRSIEFWNPQAETLAFLRKCGEVFLAPEQGIWGGRTRRFNPSKGEK